MSPRKNTCSSVIPAGTGSHMWSANGTRMASAWPPGYCLPKRPPNTARPVVAHWVGSRIRHHSQKPHEIEKGASNAVALLDLPHRGADLLHDAHELVAHHDPRIEPGHPPVILVQIGAANRAGRDASTTSVGSTMRGSGTDSTRTSPGP